jgi:hypothetical protein
MTLAFGRAYGGSTVVYTGTSLPPPARVIVKWGVPGLEQSDLLARARRYAGENNVHPLEPALLNDNNRLFAEGCAALGMEAEQFPVNVKGCLGSSLCNLGCPNGAKQGTPWCSCRRRSGPGCRGHASQVRRIDPDARRLTCS